MRPLSTHCPDLARQQTRVVELAFGSHPGPRTVAFVERYCDDLDCDCRRVALQLVDIDRNEELAAVGYEFDTPVTCDADGRVVYFERTSRGDIEAHLLRAIVEGFVLHTDYAEGLQQRYQTFRQAVENGDGSQRPSGTTPTNGATRPLRDYSAQTAHLDIEQLRSDWKNRAESPSELNRILRLFFDSRGGFGAAFEAAKTILEGLGIDIDRHQIEESAGEGMDTRFFPPHWREVVDRKWDLEAPVVEDILPLVAEALWDRWSDTPRPHQISKLIAAGYDDRYERGANHAWIRWKEAWRHVEVWVDARGGVPRGRTLTGVLDDALDIAEDAWNWFNDLGRVVREILRAGDVDEQTAVEAVDILATVTSRLTDDETVLLNNLDAARYASLRDLGRDRDALRLLRKLADRPTDDTYAGLFLAHMSALWDYETTSRELELVLGFIDRTLDCTDPEDGRLLREVRAKLQQQGR